MTELGLFTLFLQSVVLSYSGWGSVSVLHNELVERHGLLDDGQLTASPALSQATWWQSRSGDPLAFT